MISREDRKGIYDLTVELLPSVLEEIGFDAEEVSKIEDTEEIGHKFYNKFEIIFNKNSSKFYVTIFVKSFIILCQI